MNETLFNREYVSEDLILQKQFSPLGFSYLYSSVQNFNIQ